MPIEHNGRKVKEIYHGDKPISEVYHGDKKVWSKDTEESVPPYAMLHAMKTSTPISISNSNYATEFDDKNLSISTTTRTGWLGVLMADGGNLTLKDGSTETLTLTRSGNTVTCFTRADRGGTATSTVTFSSTTHPFVPVAVQISSRTRGYNVQVSANNTLGNQVGLYGSGFFDPTLNLRATNGTMNALCFGYQWTPSHYSSDWRYSNVGDYNGSSWFQQAMQHNISWDDFFGQPRQWGTLPTSHRNVTGRSEGWRYSSPVGYKEYSYTLPEGVAYSEEFWLGGALQDTPQGGGQGGQGGRSGTDYHTGDCLFADGSSGGCSNMNGTGADGSSGVLSYAAYRWHFQYSRTRNSSPNIATIRVGRGSMYCCAAYWGSQERPSSEYKNAGGPGGAGGVYQPGGTTLYGGTMPSRPARDTTQTTNTFYSSGYIHTDGTVYNRPYNISDNITSHPLTYDYWNNEAGYNEFHPQVPSMCHGLVLETFTPNDDASFNINDTWWAKYKPFYRPRRSIQFYSDHSGQRLTWPPEPTCKNRESEYKDIGAGGFASPGAGGAGGAPGGIKQNGFPGQPGKSSYIDAGGTGAAVLYYEFEEPKVV